MDSVCVGERGLPVRHNGVQRVPPADVQAAGPGLLHRGSGRVIQVHPAIIVTWISLVENQIFFWCKYYTGT